MSINNNFLSLTQKTQYSINSAPQISAENNSVACENTGLNQSSQSVIQANNSTNAENLWYNPTDAGIAEYNLISKTQNAITASILSKVSAQDIKQKLYNYYHPKLTDLGNDTNSYKTTEALAISLGFSSQAAGAKITKAQLAKATKNEANESVSNSIAGCLNLAFADKNANDEITYKEVQEVLANCSVKDNESQERTVSSEKLKTLVENCSNKIQQEFISKTPQGRAQFIIDKTRAYLSESGLTTQLEALNRLLGMQDLHHTSNDVVSGQIKFTNFTDNNVNGGYDAQFRLITTMQYPSAYSTYIDGQSKDVGITTWASDEDTSEDDFGITLNKKYITSSNVKWYEAVETLVHELVHASAYKYFTGDKVYYDAGGVYVSQWSGYAIDKMFDCGINTELPATTNNSKDYIKSHESEYINTTNINTLGMPILQFIQFMTGEYMAYSYSADFLDSIGADFWTNDALAKTGVKTSTAELAESYETEAIKTHVKNNYDNEDPDHPTWIEIPPKYGSAYPTNDGEYNNWRNWTA